MQRSRHVARALPARRCSSTTRACSTAPSIRCPSTLPVQGVHGFLSMLARLVARPPARRRSASPSTTTGGPPSASPPCPPTRRIAWRRPTTRPIRSRPRRRSAARCCAAIGVAVVGADGFEAEDVIATLAARAREPVEIASGDRDLFALVRDPDVKVLYPLRGVSNLLEVDEAEITRRYGIPGRAYVDFALLRGDPSDGLPGVPGIGEKTAAQLVAALRLARRDPRRQRPLPDDRSQARRRTRLPRRRAPRGAAGRDDPAPAGGARAPRTTRAAAHPRPPDRRVRAGRAGPPPAAGPGAGQRGVAPRQDVPASTSPSADGAKRIPT